MDNGTFEIFLSAAVPLEIMRLQERGGVTPEEIVACAREFGDEMNSDVGLECSAVVVAGYAGRPTQAKRNQVAGFIARMAKAIAVMSYCPGGITVFGQHYETKPSA